MKIIYNGNIYIAKTKKFESTSNYNHSFSVFRVGEKNPICGCTINKIHVGKSYLKDFAIDLIKNYENGN